MAVDDDELVQALKLRLEVVLPGLLEAAELPEVREYLDYDPPLLDACNTPTVWVDAAGSERSAAAGHGTTLQKYSVQSMLLVGVVVAGEDKSESSGRLRQMVRWVRKAVEGDQTVDDNALWCLWQQTDYSPSYANGAGHLVRCAILTFTVNTRVTLGSE